MQAPCHMMTISSKVYRSSNCMFFDNDKVYSSWIAMHDTEYKTVPNKFDNNGWFTVPENIFWTAHNHAQEMVSLEKTNRRKACLRDGQSGKTGFALSLAFWMRKLLAEEGKGFYLRYLIQKSSVNLRSDILSDLKKMGWKPKLDYYVDILPNYRKKEQSLDEGIDFAVRIPGNKPPHIFTILDECHIAIAINGTLDKQIIKKADIDKGDSVTDDDFAKDGWSFVKPSQEWNCDNHYVLSISATDTINNLLVMKALSNHTEPPCDLFYIKPDDNYVGVEYLMKNKQLFQAREPFISIKNTNGTFKVELSDFEKQRLVDFFNHCHENPDARTNFVRRVPRCGGKNYNGRKGYELYVKLVSNFLFSKGKAFEDFHINVLHSDFRTVDFTPVETWYTQYPISRGSFDSKQSTLDLLLQKKPTKPTINVITESMTIGERITTWENTYAMIDAEFARADVAGQSIYRTCGYWDKNKHKVLVFANIEGRRKTLKAFTNDLSFMEFQEYYKDIEKYRLSAKYPSSGYNEQKTRVVTHRPVRIAFDADEIPSEHLKWYADKYIAKKVIQTEHTSIDYSTYKVKKEKVSDPDVFKGMIRNLHTTKGEKQSDWLIISGALSLCGHSTEEQEEPEWKWGTLFADELVQITAQQPREKFTDSFLKLNKYTSEQRWKKNNCEGNPTDDVYQISAKRPVWLYREYPYNETQIRTKIKPNCVLGKKFKSVEELVSEA